MNYEFNFHDLVGLRLETENADAAEFFRAELSAHTGAVGDGLPRVELRWRHASLPRSPGPDYQQQVHKRLAHWHYRMELRDRTVEIDCVGNQLAVPMAWHMLVHPSMSFLVANQGNLMLHAAAVVREGKSLILTGKGGVGKTTTSSLLLRDGADWKLHADDYVFLEPGSRSYSYATRAHAYVDLLRWLPGLRSKLTKAELLRLLFFGSIRALSGGRVKWPVRLEATRLWPDREMAHSARVGAILLVGERTEGAVRLRRLGPSDDPAGELLEVNFKERQHFSRLLRRFLGEPAADRILSDWRRRERGLLDRVVAENAVFELRIPKRASSDAQLGQQLSAEMRRLLNGSLAEGRAEGLE